MKAAYEDGTAQVKTDEVSKKILIERGVKQVQTSLPKPIYCCTKRNLQKNQLQGISINEQHLNNLRFTDDIILFNSKPQAISIMLNDLHDKGKKNGME